MDIKYKKITVSEIASTDNETYVEVVGVIKDAGAARKNSRGNTQRIAKISDGVGTAKIIVVEQDFDNASLDHKGDVRILGRVIATREKPVVYCNYIYPISDSTDAAHCASGNSVYHGRFNEVELLFLRMLTIPHDAYLLDHVSLGGRELDFVLYRKSDNKAICAYEVDGKVHKGQRLADAIRDAELEGKLECKIIRIPAQIIFDDARDAGLIK